MTVNAKQVEIVPEFYIAADSTVAAERFGEKLRCKGCHVEVVTNLYRIVRLPKGAKVLLYLGEDKPELYGVCATARMMILRGDYERYELDGEHLKESEGV